MKTITILFTLTFFLVSSCGSVLAIENIGQSRISPASPIYFLKTIRENIELKFAATPRVTQIRQLEFATRRLREVKSLIGSSSEALIEPTLERYWYKLQNVSEKEGLRDVLSIHLETLEGLYNQISNLRAKMAVRAAVNRIIQRVDVPAGSKLVACNFLAKEASSPAFTRAEKAVLLERTQKCFNSTYLNPLPNL